MKKIKGLSLLIIISVTLFMNNKTTSAKSVKIIQIKWGPISSIKYYAKGSDCWPITWAGDNKLYTIFGDGWGFANPKIEEKLSLGLAYIDGNPENFSAYNLRVPSLEQLGDGRKGKKASGFLMVEDVFYMWVRNANKAGEQCQLAWSYDYGKNWHWSAWKIEALGYLCFLNYGKNYNGAIDNYVYSFSPNTPSAYNETDSIVLLRVDKHKITNLYAYEFYKGKDENNQPLWSRNIEERVPVYILDGACNRLDVVYNQPLGIYMMTLRSRAKEKGKNQFSIHYAPNPWGPWRTAFYTETWEGNKILNDENKHWGESQHIPSKWISKDGKSFYLVFSGNDAFALRQGTIYIEEKEIKIKI